MQTDSIAKIKHGLKQMAEKRKAELEYEIEMAKKYQFIDRNKNFITTGEHMELMKNRSFTVVREFENDTLFARIIFDSQIRNPDIPREHWTPFKLIVENIMITDGDGRPLPAPIRVKDVDASNDFRTEKEAINSYEDLLVRHAGCEFFPGSLDESGNASTIFMERGNKLKPPPPDMPIATEMTDQESIGSW